MKLGLFTVLYPELDLESILECAQQLGAVRWSFPRFPAVVCGILIRLR